MSAIPALVRSARALARELAFENSCTDGTGRLLRALTATVRNGVVAELGTGCGVGSAWIAGALAPDARLITVEIEPVRAERAARLLAGEPNTTVLSGDWREVLLHAPFALLFADGGAAKDADAETLLAAVQPGGLVVLDDMTPVEHWPAEWHGRRDEVREFWLHDPRVAAVEVRLGTNKFGTAPEAALVAARLR